MVITSRICHLSSVSCPVSDTDRGNIPLPYDCTRFAEARYMITNNIIGKESTVKRRKGHIHTNAHMKM